MTSESIDFEYIELRKRRDSAPPTLHARARRTTRNRTINNNSSKVCITPTIITPTVETALNAGLGRDGV